MSKPYFCFSQEVQLKSSHHLPKTRSRPHQRIMQSIRQVARLNEIELEKCVPSNASWHTDYRDTAYLYIGGLPFDLSEGDVVAIFSQYGNPVHINLIRDKETGKSRGYCFLKYEDQRSCDLAVDNLSGAGVMGRLISVDHTRYRKKEGEIERVGDDEDDRTKGAVHGERHHTASESESEEERPLIREEIELQKLIHDHDDDDPMKAYLVKEKKAEVEEALKIRLDQSGGRRHADDHRHRRRHSSKEKRRERRRDDRKKRRKSPDEREDSDHRRAEPSARTSRQRKRSTASPMDVSEDGANDDTHRASRRAYPDSSSLRRRHDAHRSE